MGTTTVAAMAAAGVIHGEFGQFRRLNQFQIVFDAAVDSPIDLQSGGQQFVQRPSADSAGNHRINPTSAKRIQRLTLTVYMITFRVLNGIKRPVIGFNNHKIIGRTEMSMHNAVQAPIFLRRKSNFHKHTPNLNYQSYEYKAYINSESLRSCQGFWGTSIILLVPQMGRSWGNILDREPVPCTCGK
jgi:hypothetical protein